MKMRLIGLILSLMIFSSAAAMGGTLGEFHNTFGDAYTLYKKALFLTNKNKQSPSLKALQGFETKIINIQEQYQENPPAPYNESPRWENVFAQTLQITRKGISEIKQNQLKKSHETIEKIRDLYAVLRNDVSLKVFSDYINAYHHEMEGFLKAHSKSTLNDEKMIQAREGLAVLSYLMNDAKNHAPEAYVKNPKFNKLLGNNIVVLTKLKAALEQKNVQQVKTLLKQVKPAYAKLFINFG